MTEMEILQTALKSIAGLGGNLPDERLTSRTGPNDAAHRGLMYCEARRLALAALWAVMKFSQAERFLWPVRTCTHDLPALR